MGVSDHLTCLLRNVYAGQEATVRTLYGTAEWFKIEKGVWQGCLLSPCLFNLYTEHIMRNARLDELQFSPVQSLSRVWLFVTPWTAAHQASLSITNFPSPPKPMSIESVMPSNYLNLCRPLLLLPSIFPTIRVFSNESVFRITWPKYWSSSFNISPSNEHPGLISFRITGWISSQSKGLSRIFSNTAVQKHQFFGTQPSSQSNSHIHRGPLKPLPWLDGLLLTK